MQDSRCQNEELLLPGQGPAQQETIMFPTGRPDPGFGRDFSGRSGAAEPWKSWSLQPQTGRHFTQLGPLRQ